MSQYSFLDELIIAEGCVSNLNSALHSCDSQKVEYACKELRNVAGRILRKLRAYEDFYEHSEAVAGGVQRVPFINFGNGEEAQ